MRDRRRRPPGEARPAGSRTRRRWLAVCIALACAIAGSVAWPVFVTPQLDPDDYRYLQLARSLDEDFAGRWVEASTVENRWDHLWWMAETRPVRFFRPTVVLSYWLDWKLHGPNVVVGLLLTNLLLYLACVALAAVLLVQWVGPGLPALLGSALFAAFWCHGEVLWYVAGRTDTLAALGFLAGLALHQAGSRRPALRGWAVPCYGFAFLSKELAVALPLVCVLHDWLIERRAASPLGVLRRAPGLYAAYAAVLVGIQALRAGALGGGDWGAVYPYFVSPERPEFPLHLWGQLRSYGENLLLARTTKPFLQPGEIAAFTTTAGLVVSVGVGSLFVVALHRERLFWLLLGLGLLTWLPTGFVYVSERYLFLPSLALAGSASLLLVRLRPQPALRALGLVAMGLWIAHQGYRLAFKNHWMSVRAPRLPYFMEPQLARVAPQIPAGARVLVLNLPGIWLDAQFTEAQLREQLGDPALQVRVLTIMPTDAAMGEGMEVERAGPRVLVVRGGRSGAGPARAPLLDGRGAIFPWRTLAPGARSGGPRLGFEVEVLEGSGTRASALRFALDEPLASYTLLRWHPHPDPGLSLNARRRLGWVERVRP